MAQLVQNDPLVMQAQTELEHFSADAQMRELERRRKLWKLDYYSGLAAAHDDGREEGRIEEKAKDVLSLLRRSCGEVPETLVQKIYSITDLELLGRLLDLTYDRPSLEEFEKNIP